MTQMKRCYVVSISISILYFPDAGQIERLIQLYTANGHFSFDHPEEAKSIIAQCQGLSYYSIQKDIVYGDQAQHI